MLNRLKWLNIAVLTALIVIFWFMAPGGVNTVYYMRITPLFQLVAIPVFISSGLFIAFSFVHAFREKVFSFMYLYLVASIILVLLVLFFMPEIYILLRRWVQATILVLLIINQIVMWIIYDEKYEKDGSYVVHAYETTVDAAKHVIDKLNHVTDKKDKK